MKLKPELAGPLPEKQPAFLQDIMSFCVRREPTIKPIAPEDNIY